MASSFAKHFDGKRFYNPGSPQANGLGAVLRWKLTSRPQPSPAFVDDVIPTVPPGSVEPGSVHCTLVNHSTVLLQENAANFLTDPIWSERASPISWAGPKRRRAPGIRREELPPVQVVLLSHNHYDHLDLPTLRWLAQKGGTQFVVPLGVAKLLRSEGIQPVHELDWGDSWQFEGGAVHCVPALHFSARGVSDRNRTLWCGYVIQIRDLILYYAADTAFGSHFEEIRAQFGPPALSLLPIGAYEPRWFMSPVHMAPEEALQAHRVLGSQHSIAIHHGTFQLADEGLDAPAELFSSLAPPDSFQILKNGESADIFDVPLRNVPVR